MGSICSQSPQVEVDEKNNGNGQTNSDGNGNNNGQSRMDRPPSHSHLDLSNMNDSGHRNNNINNNNVKNNNGKNIKPVNKTRTHRMVNDAMKKYRKSDESIRKLLLLGSGSAGKSTLFKQIKRVHGLAIADTEFEETEHTIRTNCVSGILVLLKQSELLYDLNPKLHAPCKIDLNNSDNKDIVDWIQYVIGFASENFENYQTNMNTMNNTNNNNNNSTDQLENELNSLGVCISNLWSLPQIQETFNRREMFSFPDNLDWFLSKAEYIFSFKFEPDYDDVLRVRIRTSGLYSQSYSIDEKVTLLIVDVGGQRAERRKWINYFQDVTAVIFVAAMNHYCAVLFEDEKKNAMRESLELFYEIVNSKWFRKTEIILFLNKMDLFINRMRDGIPLSVCFDSEWQGPDYNPNFIYAVTDPSDYNNNNINYQFNTMNPSSNYHKYHTNYVHPAKSDMILNRNANNNNDVKTDNENENENENSNTNENNNDIENARNEYNIEIAMKFSNDNDYFEHCMRAARNFITQEYLKCNKSFVATKLGDDQEDFASDNNKSLLGIPLGNEQNTVNRDRSVYFHFTTATDQNNIRKVFVDVTEIVIKYNLYRGGLI